MPDEVIRSIQTLLEGLVNESNVHRRLVLEGAILDLFEVAMMKHELRLPVVIVDVSKKQRLTKKEHVEELVRWLKKVVATAARELDEPPSANSLIRTTKSPFKRSLLVQGVLIQLMEQGIFGEQSVFKLAVKLPSEGGQEKATERASP